MEFCSFDEFQPEFQHEIDIDFHNELNDSEVDFSNMEIILPTLKEKVIEINYDHTTREKYKAFRFRKMDPILLIELEDRYAFKF